MTAPTTPVRIADIYAAQKAKPSLLDVPKSKSIGKDDFLAMLVAQLKNQDPTSPMDGTQFAAQLAQFSNVEQLVNISEKMDTQNSIFAQSQLTAQTALGASLIGRNVLIEGNQLPVTGDKTPIKFSLEADAATMKVTVLDSAGKVVKTQDFTKLPKGQQQLSLDTEDLDPGSYTYKIEAKNVEGKAVKAASFEAVQIDGISFKDGAIQIRVGNRTIPLLNIIEITPQSDQTASTNLKESSTP